MGADVQVTQQDNPFGRQKAVEGAYLLVGEVGVYDDLPKDRREQIDPFS